MVLDVPDVSPENPGIELDNWLNRFGGVLMGPGTLPNAVLGAGVVPVSNGMAT